jgi:hypothetical protein
MSGDAQTERVHFTIQISNESEQEVMFRLEPWGEIYPMPSGITFDVVADGPSSDTLEVVWEPNTISVYGWPGSVVRVYYNGTQLSGATWPPSP